MCVLNLYHYGLFSKMCVGLNLNKKHDSECCARDLFLQTFNTAQYNEVLIWVRKIRQACRHHVTLFQSPLHHDVSDIHSKKSLHT
jgi:hypothetical protein